jgi:hypothetical protein
MMKPFRAWLLGCAVAAFAGTATASSGSLVEFTPRIMPVVVQVNAQGRVTDVLPSQQLEPWAREMLVKQIDAWIAEPAMDHGKPTASRFIMEVAMRVQPRKDGKYDANFVYVKSMPLAYGGALHWDVINGGLELALVSDGTGSRANHTLRHFERFPSHPLYQPQSPRPSPHASEPRSAPRAPAPASAMPMRSGFSGNAAPRFASAPRAARQ